MAAGNSIKSEMFNGYEKHNQAMKSGMKATVTLFASLPLTERQSSVLHLSSTAYGLLRKISVRTSLRQRFAGPRFTPHLTFFLPVLTFFACVEGSVRHSGHYHGQWSTIQQLCSFHNHLMYNINQQNTHLQVHKFRCHIHLPSHATSKPAVLMAAVLLCMLKNLPWR